MTTLDLAGAAALLLVHEHTVEEWARSGRLPAAKPGKRWVFVEADLIAWLRTHYREERAWPSTEGAKSGGAGGGSAARKLGSLLARPIAPRRRNHNPIPRPGASNVVKLNQEVTAFLRAAGRRKTG